MRQQESLSSRKRSHRSGVAACLFLLTAAAVAVFLLTFCAGFGEDPQPPAAAAAPALAAQGPPTGVAAEAFRGLPHGHLRMWRRHEHLVVLGIPSVDDEPRRRRRNLQRWTCWRFPGVATRAE
ncbi:UDP-Gal or UDP-GlcNAc-dependent glycosyltransferase [Trypanosoma conorhini]|uniref:UDP-Gal or UDP-GlcNAc-dependent glycosyltransferase n=1 Tax=Trypanosoma conorhini TaxID=83891 RepID=A0A3R7LYZ5_9TRYP|nr:UDP-Gal or UDP-GlcNAc-dependent glycosyltransferase [Trypanosoma conorhini]RNF23409.1 UDP-Gal or UDP-GlcNAc-dependent glycosyltransferase [Trypanosoma conorhini]